MIRVRDRLLLVVLGVIFLALAVYSIYSLIEERRFVTGDFVGWAESNATVEDSRISILGITSSGKDFVYSLRYEYKVSFDTAAGRVIFDYSIDNQEKRAESNLSADDFRPINAGDAGTVSYDPGNPEDYRWGNKAAITKNATNPTRFLICIALIAGSGLIIWIAIRPFINKKEKRPWHETDEPQIPKE